jgi:uncharacterized repeat protein (TIGR01451 family)
VTKTVTKDNPLPLDRVVYPIVVKNIGDGDATGVQVLDKLPSGVTFSSARMTVGNYDFVTGIWNIGPIDAGGSEVLLILATVNGGTGGQTITNTAAIDSVDQTDPVPENDSDDAEFTVQEGIFTALTKTVTDDTPDEDQTIVFTISVRNDGPSDATGLILDDKLPAGLTYDSHTGVGNYNEATGEWNIGSLPSGATAVLDLTVTVDAGTGGEQITNTASVKEVDQPNSGGTPADVTINVKMPGATGVDIAVTKTVDIANPSETERVVFTVTAKNNGTIIADGIQIEDVVPEGLTVTDIFESSGIYSEITGIWEVDAALGTGLFETLTITARVDLGQAGKMITNEACLTNVDPVDSNPNNDCGSVDVTVSTIDLAVTKTVSNENPLPFDQIVYTIGVENIGDGEATGVKVLDKLPIGVGFNSAQPTVGRYDFGTGIWDFELEGIDAGVREELLILATVNSGSDGQTITNTAAIDSVDQTDPVPENDSADAVITVQETIFTTLTKTVTDFQPAEGQPIVFTITVKNGSSTANATGLILEDQLPAGLTYDSHTETLGTYNEANGEWNIGSLASGVTADLEITVTVDAGTSGTQITNIVSVKAVDQVDDGGSPADVTLFVN